MYGKQEFSRRRWTVCDFDLVSENEGVMALSEKTANAVKTVDGFL